MGPLEASGEASFGETHIFAGKGYVITVRHGPSSSYKEVRARCESAPRMLRKGEDFVLYALMDAVVDRYFPVIEALEERLEATEARIFAGEPARGIVEALYGLKRELTTLQHAVRPLLEATGKLYGGRVPAVCAGLPDYFRDVYDHLSRINQSVESLREMLSTAMGVNLSLISLQENETTKRLASYGALIAIPTLIAGLYGMNFQQMPELHWSYGYPFAIAIMVGLDLWMFSRFRRAGWL